MEIERFTYPFCYTPAPEIKEAAQELTRMIDDSPALRQLFAEGKMLGVLIARAADGSIITLHGFSGLVGGRSHIDGFVPPIFDTTDPDGHFKKTEAAISALNAQIATLEKSGTAPDTLTALREQRKSMSNDLQEWLFQQYIVSNATGRKASVGEIFASLGITPPGGTGDCAAPKLLQHAYNLHLTPLAMGEFWYGKAPLRELRLHGHFYPSCFGKCGPLLTYMMEGLDVAPNPLDQDKEWLDMSGEQAEPRIIWQDESIIVVDKPSGMLSVPGKTGKKSLLEWLQERIEGEVHSCHRLDMDTSGVMVYARNVECKVAMERMFAEHQVTKTYVARLIATPQARPLRKGHTGTISLPLAADYYDRPRQMVDPEQGRKAVTRYEVLEMLPGGEVDVRFTPLTGRTHQLRVHAAHPQGLGRPIKGDRLYGGVVSGSEKRLCLHADSITFTHPVTGEKMSFSTLRAQSFNI